jgi:hypothetical protein
MANKILITLDEPTENALRKLAEDSDTTMSRVVRDLIISKQSTDKIEVEERAILASVRKTERDVQVAIGVLNSIALGFPTLSDALYQDPDEHKHDILRGAERAENAKIRKRIQARNFSKNGENVNEQ